MPLAHHQNVIMTRIELTIIEYLTLANVSPMAVGDLRRGWERHWEGSRKARRQDVFQSING